MQTHTASGVPKTILFIDEFDDEDYFSDMKLELEEGENEVHYAVQLAIGKNANGDTTYAPAEIFRGGASQGNTLHITQDILEKIKTNKPTFDAVDHDNDGKMDAIKLTMDGKEFDIPLPDELKNQRDVLQPVGQE